MTQLTTQRDRRELPLAALDRPALDARIDRDADQMEALKGDIARRGLIYPLIVVQVGDRYEIVDGFSRFICLTQLGWVAAECLIYPSKELALEGVKYAGNEFRIDMSPADEAVYFRQLYDEECGGDIEKLCALVNKKESYVNNRLELLAGDEAIFDALRAKQISIGVAQELNKLPDEGWRRYYLQFAVRDGATVSSVSGWVQQWKAAHEGIPEQPGGESAAAVSPAAPVFEGHRCYVCQRIDPRRVPQMVAIHAECLYATLDPMLRAYRGEPDGTT
jgi:ParB/RepB/Spo0J family partition protein